MSKTLYLSDERAIGVDETYNVGSAEPFEYYVFDLDLVADVDHGDPWHPYATSEEALAAAHKYLSAQGLKANQ